MDAQDIWIETRLGRMHARTLGAGPAVVLLHGRHPDNDWRVWEHNIGALAGAGCTVYALDLLGYGESDRPHGEGGQIPDHNRQAVALLDLMDAQKLQTAIVGGVSWGGMIALELALTAPHRISSLILVDSAGAGYYAEERLQSVSCPVMVVWGEDDTILPLAHAAWFGATIPGSRVEVIPDVTGQAGVPRWAGHHPMRFRPDQFNRLALRFIQDLQ